MVTTIKNRAINPTKKDMENILRNMREKNNSKTDQHRLKDLVEDYKEEENFAYFQPCEKNKKKFLGINQHIKEREAAEKAKYHHRLRGIT